MNWLQRMLGGRPMTYVGHAFVDVVNGKDVFYWRDRYGRVWMAHTRWGWFRTRARALEAFDNTKKKYRDAFKQLAKS